MAGESDFISGGIRLDGTAGCGFGNTNVLVCRVSTSSDLAVSWKGTTLICFPPEESLFKH